MAENETIYIKHHTGFVRRVTAAQYASAYSVQLSNSERVAAPGWTVVDEAEARTANPQMFGTVDPRVEVNRTKSERAELKERAEAVTAAEAEEAKAKAGPEAPAAPGK